MCRCLWFQVIKNYENYLNYKKDITIMSFLQFI